MIDVVCVKHGNLYDWSWVDKLYRGALRSFTSQVNFHVFTDTFNQHASYNQIQLPHFEDLSGRNKSNAAWWYKICLFSDINPIRNQQIYFDLDVVLVGNCDFLLDVPNNKIGMCEEWNELLREKQSTNTKFNSSVMVFNPIYYKYLWNQYISNRKGIQQKYFGDQSFITHRVPARSMYKLDSTSKILSWKYQVYQGGVKQLLPDNNFPKNIKQYNTPGISKLPSDARVVTFGGDDMWKPSSAMDVDFVKEFWL